MAAPCPRIRGCRSYGCLGTQVAAESGLEGSTARWSKLRQRQEGSCDIVGKGAGEGLHGSWNLCGQHQDGRSSGRSGADRQRARSEGAGIRVGGLRVVPVVVWGCRPFRVAGRMGVRVVGSLRRLGDVLLHLRVAQRSHETISGVGQKGQDQKRCQESDSRRAAERRHRVCGQGPVRIFVLLARYPHPSWSGKVPQAPHRPSRPCSHSPDHGRAASAAMTRGSRL